MDKNKNSDSISYYDVMWISLSLFLFQSLILNFLIICVAVVSCWPLEASHPTLESTLPTTGAHWWHLENGSQKDLDTGWEVSLEVTSEFTGKIRSNRKSMLHVQMFYCHTSSTRCSWQIDDKFLPSSKMVKLLLSEWLDKGGDANPCGKWQWNHCCCCWCSGSTTCQSIWWYLSSRCDSQLAVRPGECVSWISGNVLHFIIT